MGRLPESHNQDWMIKPATGEAKASRNVFRFEVRQFLEDLLLSESCSKQVQDVDHPNPHATDTGPPSALCRIRSDARDKFSHMRNFADACSRNALSLSACDLRKGEIWNIRSVTGMLNDHALQPSKEGIMQRCVCVPLSWERHFLGADAWVHRLSHQQH